MRRRPPRLHPIALVALAVLVVLAAGGAAWWVRQPSAPPATITVTGPEKPVLNAADVRDLAVEVTTDTAGALDEAVLLVDGADVTARSDRTATSLRWAPEQIADGEHAVSLTVPGRVLDDIDVSVPPQDASWTFAVDQTAPTLSLDERSLVRVGDDPVAASGAASDDATVSASGGEIEQAADGRFTIAFDDPQPAPAEVVEVVAVDAAGNTARAEVTVTSVPSRVQVDKIRGVHVTAHAWTSDRLREDVLDLARAGKINAVQLDLKDEDGLVGYATGHELAREIGADLGLYDLDEAVEELHDLGVEVIGRIVVFRDGAFARHAWSSGMRDDVVQTAAGDLYTGSYEGFSSITSERVWRYNIAIAEEAAAAGVDNILWDYVRKPDGAMSSFSFAGLDESVEPERAAQDAVLEFIATADERLEPYGVKHGASVYGIAADRPHEIAQDVGGMAQHLDYVAPMVYPSHWAPGEYGVADPNAQPGLIVQRSLEVFLDEVEGTDAEVVPWLQDFPWPVTYTPAMVRDQIDKAADVGVDQWLMWNAGVYYQDAAYDVITDADVAADHAGS